MADSIKEGSISARAKIPVERIDPLNDPDIPPDEGLRYMAEKYGIKTMVIRPLRTDTMEKKRMIEMIKFQKAVHNLWGVYWVGRDAKVINKLFMDAHLLCAKFLGYATNTEVLLDMKSVWGILKTQITPKMLASLGRIPGKGSTEEQRKKSKELHAEITRLWKENP